MTFRRKMWLTSLLVGMALCALRATAANYYSMQNPDWPPMPVVPFDVPVYDLGGGMFAYDDLDVDYVQLRAARRQALMDSEGGPPEPGEGEGEGGGESGPPAYNFSTNDLWVEIILVTNNSVSLVIHAPDTNVYDLYWTFELIGNYATNSSWRWVGQGTNSQHLSFPNARCRAAFYMLGSRVDSDGDNLSDAFEVLSSKTSPATNHTYSAELTDLEWWLRSNILVNDPEQDCETEQNTQDETTLIALDDTVVVAWVDSNQGVPGYGNLDASCGLLNLWFPPRPPEFIGWSVSHNGGVTFEDKGGPPLLSNVWAFQITNTEYHGFFATTNLGNAGDPVLAGDKALGTIYLTGNPQRPSVYYPDGTNHPANLFVPLWRSTNNGETFLPPVNAIAGLTPSNAITDWADKPALIVDNFPGVGQGDVYSAIKWQGGPNALIVSRSDAGGTNWQVLQTALGGLGANTPYFAIFTNDLTEQHEICLTWIEGNPQSVFFSKSTDRGTNFTSPVSILTFSNAFTLYRSNSAAAEDSFRAGFMPALVANPITNHLYLVYADAPSNNVNQPNIYFIQSSNGGTNWSGRIQVNAESNSVPTDQWQPAITVKPDGTKLFVAWYDRRNDPTNNFLIQIYGTFASLPITSTNTFATNFVISTAHFPPVFTGTNKVAGTYDPVYPAGISCDDPRGPGSFFGIYSHHMGDYDLASSDDNHVFYTWADNRNTSPNQSVVRNQADIRIVRLSWPRACT